MKIRNNNENQKQLKAIKNFGTNKLEIMKAIKSKNMGSEEIRNERKS